VFAPTSGDSNAVRPVPHRMSDAEHRAGTTGVSEEGIARGNKITSSLISSISSAVVTQRAPLSQPPPPPSRPLPTASASRHRTPNRRRREATPGWKLAGYPYVKKLKQQTDSFPPRLA